MVKHIYPLIVFLSFTINIFSQETSIATKFIDNGNLYKSLGYTLNVSPNSFSMGFLMEEYGVFQDKGVSGTNKKYNK